MSKKHLLLAVLFTLCLASWAWADGGFYGSITYHNCSCYHAPQNGDLVYIQSTEGGEPYHYPIGNCSGNPSYSTGSETFPPGHYNLWVATHTGSDCNRGYVQTVYHGSSDQEVGLRVEKTPPPDQ